MFYLARPYLAGLNSDPTLRKKTRSGSEIEEKIEYPDPQLCGEEEPINLILIGTLVQISRAPMTLEIWLKCLLCYPLQRPVDQSIYICQGERDQTWTKLAKFSWIQNVMYYLSISNAVTSRPINIYLPERVTKLGPNWRNLVGYRM